jgi:hypothetical protein
MSELEVPDWLERLLASDDPPTAIDPTLLKRLASAGATRFLAANRKWALANADAATATGIAIAGPGIVGLVEMFEGEPDKAGAALARLVASAETFDKMRRLALAALDMHRVANAADRLADRDGPERLVEEVLETGIVVTYARHYLDSNKGGGVGAKWRPRGTADRKLHDWLIEEMRDPYHAHADRTPMRTLVNSRAILGLHDQPPAWGEARRRITDEELVTIADLARRQGERLGAEADRLGALLEERWLVDPDDETQS